MGIRRQEGISLEGRQEGISLEGRHEEEVGELSTSAASSPAAAASSPAAAAKWVQEDGESAEEEAGHPKEAPLGLVGGFPIFCVS